MILDKYKKGAGVWPTVPIPTVENYMQAALSSKDPAPGPDGIPYAFWKTFPHSSSEAMCGFMTDTLLNQRPPPLV